MMILDKETAIQKNAYTKEKLEGKSMENDTDNQVLIPDHRKLIIEMAANIHDQRMLESVYSFIMGILSVKEKQEAD